MTTSKCGSSPDSAACSSAALRHSSTTRSMQAIISGNSTLSVSFRSRRSTNQPLVASACAAQYSSGRSTVYPMPGMMSTCLPVSVFFTRFLPHGVTAGVTFFVVGCVPFLPMLCLIRLFVCSVRLGRSLWPASFPILHARRRRLQSFPSVHHALVVVDFRGHVVRFGVVDVPVRFSHPIFHGGLFSDDYVHSIKRSAYGFRNDQNISRAAHTHCAWRAARPSSTGRLPSCHRRNPHHGAPKGVGSSCRHPVRPTSPRPDLPVSVQRNPS